MLWVCRSLEGLFWGKLFAHSKDFLLRSRFLSDCRFLPSSRASFAALVGFVGLRFFGMMSALLTRSTRRSSASSLFLVWLLMSLATTRMLPSAVMRVASLWRSLSRCSSVNARDDNRFQNTSMRDDVLLTCWPPAPEERDARKSSSPRGMDTVSVTKRNFSSDAPAGSVISASGKV